MAFAVVYDACVLYPAPLRDLLIRLARSGAFRAHWSEQIFDEVFRWPSCASWGPEEKRVGFCVLGGRGLPFFS